MTKCPKLRPVRFLLHSIIVYFCVLVLISPTVNVSELNLSAYVHSYGDDPGVSGFF